MAGVKGIQLLPSMNGEGKRVAIVRTRWNATVIDALVSGAREELQRCGVKPEDILEVQVRRRLLRVGWGEPARPPRGCASASAAVAPR